MKNRLLVINSGSSSIKFAIYRIMPTDRLVEELKGHIEGIGNFPTLTVTRSDGVNLIAESLDNPAQCDHKNCFNEIRLWLKQYLGQDGLQAIGHRVVHGGHRFVSPVLIDDEVIDALETLNPLAPLHQPHNLAAVRCFRDLMPDLPQVACFDTAFHHTQPEIARLFGLPRQFYEDGVRRYGFHGLSYEYVASALPKLGLQTSGNRIIVAHLGNGASLCALSNGFSVATTMGFSPLDGLLMGTRCGTLDPGVLLYLIERYRMDAKALAHLFYHESGLLGISGLSNDMRVLLSSEHTGAREAIDLFVYRIGREIGSLVAALGGLDALVFTGGIGENSSEIRERVCRQAHWLGLELDDEANRNNTACLSTGSSKISVWVVKTDENAVIAQHTHDRIKVPFA